MDFRQETMERQDNAIGLSRGAGERCALALNESISPDWLDF